MQFVKNQMKSYELKNIVPRLISYLDGLSNWCVRLKRGN